MSNIITSDSFKSSLPAMIDAIFNNLVEKFDLEDKLLKTVESWPNSFVSSIPVGIEALTHEDELVEKFETRINTWSKEYFTKRLENNEYLTYSELIKND